MLYVDLNDIFGLMKKLKAVDLLRHRLIWVFAPDEEEFFHHEKVFVKNNKEQLVAKIVDPEGQSSKKQNEDDWVFERKLTAKDLEDYEKAQEGEKERILKTQELANEQNLEMRVFASRVGWQKRIVSFFFTCEEAVDFRELLKLLNAEFQCRIHLERVGARDKAKIIGGFGACGQETCCSTFKVDLPPVPMDAVRDQGIMIKDNTKLMGLCGKLKCCLLYEVADYRKMRKSLPHLKQTVTTSKGQKARVIGLDILNQKVKVIVLDSDTMETFDASELKKESSGSEKSTQKAK